MSQDPAVSSSRSRDAKPSAQKRRRPGRSKRLNLALQGGGAHGAFTWGAMEALLEHTRIEFDGISGTSAGAVNAVALAAGLMDGGRDGARENLHKIWDAISHAGAPGSHPDSPLAYLPAAALTGSLVRLGLGHLSNTWSPYALNPLNINPLRSILLDHIDFDRLRRESPVRLFIAATEVSSGRARIFRTEEITVDAVLASACLPVLFPAIQIDGVSYWDGGYSANPDLISLISETRAGDTILIQISPDRDHAPPVSTDEIAGNIARLSFNQPLRSQIEKIELHRRTPIRLGSVARRLGGHRIHLIDGSRHTLKLRAETKTHPDWQMISKLRDQGHVMAINWLDDHFGNLGKRATVDLYARYFTDRSSAD